jgi:hypothetical protein
MRGAIPPLPHTSSGRCAYLSMGHVLIVWYLVKRRDNFTLTTTTAVIIMVKMLMEILMVRFGGCSKGKGKCRVVTVLFF